MEDKRKPVYVGVAEVTAVDILQWQNEMLCLRDENGVLTTNWEMEKMECNTYEPIEKEETSCQIWSQTEN